MISIVDQLTTIVSEAFEAAGYERRLGRVELSRVPEIGHYQCNGALAGAKLHRCSPMQIAERVSAQLSAQPVFKEVTTAAPGYLNFRVTDEFLLDQLSAQDAAPQLGCGNPASPQKVFIDFGGANVAKPLHVGHLRSAILGECLKRMARFLGHTVLSDVHLGDWGLQMGMLIYELSQRRPDLPYFSAGYTGPYPDESPVTISDLDELYPAASTRSKQDPEYLEAARKATAALHEGRPGYIALWRHFVSVSTAELHRDYDALGVEFDLWLGESNAHHEAVALVESLLATGLAETSDGAVVIRVDDSDGKNALPPLLLRKSDGAILYATTDLATLAQRIRDFEPDVILYVVDARQADHFRQLFIGSRLAGIAPESVGLEHIAFGTMNGPDGKPFKTRSGGTMKLRELIQYIRSAAEARLMTLVESRQLDGVSDDDIARMVGVAALKFADLANQRTKDYVFDVDRFSSFEGRTGPYLLYSTVRAHSIIRKAEAAGYDVPKQISPLQDADRKLVLALLNLPEALLTSWQQRMPNLLCEYAYQLATAFNEFYHCCRILQEPDAQRRSTLLWITEASRIRLSTVLELLGIEVPERM
jgi:arginyl-tRNA synthetase